MSGSGHKRNQIEMLIATLLITIVVLGLWLNYRANQPKKIALHDPGLSYEWSTIEGSGSDTRDEDGAGNRPSANEGVTPEEVPVESLALISVDVAGAVNAPGLYQLPEGARVDEAIEAAGGVRDGAWIHLLNRAERLHDEQKIFVLDEHLANEFRANRWISPLDGSLGGVLGVESESEDKVDINRASEQRLTDITGIGPALAGRITAYREQHGAFTRIEDLLGVQGIGPATLVQMKEQIAIIP